METTSETMVATATATTTAPAEARPLTAGEVALNYLVFGMSTIASVAFAYYLISDPSRLNDAWAWIRGLPLAVQLAMWLLLLPWMLALWCWNMPWALGIRLVLVVGMLLFTEYLVFPWKK